MNENMLKLFNQWVFNYYKFCLGLPLDAEVELPNDIENVFYNKFVAPINFMCTGSKERNILIPELKDRLAELRTLMGNAGYSDWVYIIYPMVENGYFKYTGKFTKDLEEAIKELDKNLVAFYATISPDAKDIVLHRTHTGKLYNLPMPYVKYPKSVKTYTGQKTLASILPKDYSRLSDDEVYLIRSAYRNKVIKDTNIQYVEYQSPITGTIIKSPITDETIPPPEYFNILENMSEFSKDSEKTDLENVASVASVMAVGKSLKSYLNKHIRPTKEQFSEDDVVKYLNARGIEIDSIDSLKESIDSIQQQTPYVLNEEYAEDVLNMSVTEFMSSVASNKNEVVRLDEYIENYCIRNNISLKCTVAQLIQAISYDVKPEVLSNRDLVANIVAEEKLNINMTLEDYIRGWKYTPPDPADAALSYIADNPLFPGKVEDLIRDTILYDKPLTEDVLADKLELSNKEDKQEVDYFDEIGYISGEHMLRAVREEISKDASFDVRNNLTPILYCFLRSLMGDFNKEKQSIVETFKKYYDESSGKANDILKSVLLLIE